MLLAVVITAFSDVLWSVIFKLVRAMSAHAAPDTFAQVPAIDEGSPWVALCIFSTICPAVSELVAWVVTFTLKLPYPDPKFKVVKLFKLVSKICLGCIFLNLLSIFILVYLFCVLF